MAQIPKKIKQKLTEVVPSIAFKVEWEIDPYFKWDGDGPDPRNKGQFPHDVTVTASAIVNGEIVVGQDNLGGCYDAPGKTCPDVHGYLLDMLSNALDDLNKNASSMSRKFDSASNKYSVEIDCKDAQKLIEQLRKQGEKDA